MRPGGRGGAADDRRDRRHRRCRGACRDADRAGARRPPFGRERGVAAGMVTALRLSGERAPAAAGIGRLLGVEHAEDEMERRCVAAPAGAKSASASPAAGYGRHRARAPAGRQPPRQRALGQSLQPCRPLDLAQAARHRRRVDAEMRRETRRQPARAGVDDLVAAEQRRPRQRPVAAAGSEAKRRRSARDLPFLAMAEERQAERSGPRLEDRRRLRRLRRHRRRYAGLQDAGLLAGDQRQRVAEILR